MRLTWLAAALVLGQAAPPSDAPEPATKEAWWGRRAARPDGGSRPDDGGAPDAGSDAGTDAGPPERWDSADAGFHGDGGVTDRLTLRVGARLQLRFPRVLLMSQCDAALVRFEPLSEAIDVVGLDAGVTQCGFWYLKEWSQPGAQPFPDRLFEVRVLPAR